MSVDVNSEERRRKMSTIMKAFCVLGLIAGGLLCLFDWLTSIDGVTTLLGEGKRPGIVASLLPLTFATLAIAFNASSSYWFALFVKQGCQFSEFSSGVTTVVWVFSVVYDCTSSLLGLTAIYTDVTVKSWAAVNEAIGILGGFGAFFILMIAGLLSLSPFICAMFGEVLKENSE